MKESNGKRNPELASLSPEESINLIEAAEPAAEAEEPTVGEALSRLAAKSAEPEMNRDSGTARQLVQAEARSAKHPKPVPEKGKKYRLLPCGFVFLLLFILLAMYSQNIQAYRAWTVSVIADLLEPSIGTENSMMADLDYAETLNDLDYHGAEAAYKRTVEKLSRVCQPGDQRLSYAKLELALCYLKSDQAKLAEPICREQLKLLTTPSDNTPRKMTALLETIAHKYDDDLGDREKALKFYLATLRFWSHAPGLNTVSNVRANIAEIYLADGDYVRANEYFRLAYDWSKQWGDQVFNVYRLWQIGYTYDQMGKYSDALPYLEKANAMAKIAKWPQGDELVNLEKELLVAREGSLKKMDALHSNFIPSAVFDDTQNRFSVLVDELWKEGKRQQGLGNTRLAASILQRAYKLSKQSGCLSNDEMQKLSHDLQSSQRQLPKGQTQ